MACVRSSSQFDLLCWRASCFEHGMGCGCQPEELEHVVISFAAGPVMQKMGS